MLSATLLTKCADAPTFPRPVSKQVFRVVQSVTAAQVNSVFSLIGAGHDCSVRTVGVEIRVGGTAVTGLTTLVLQDTDGNTIASWAQADLTANARYGTMNSQTVIGAKFEVALPVGVGIRLTKTGGSAAGGPVNISLACDVA